MKSFDTFVSEGKRGTNDLPDGSIRDVLITRADYDHIQREAWNNCVNHATYAVKSVQKDWQSVGAFEKDDAADYLLLVATIEDVARWSQTLQGGKQSGFDFMFEEEDFNPDDAATPCQSGYCE